MARHRKLTQKFAGFPMFKLATSGDTYPLTSPFTSDFVGLDGLALDLQFAADKTLTARKGPTPAFTRGSMATFVDSDGLIKYGAENLSPSFTSYSKVQLQTPASISDGITADSLRYTPTGTPTGYMFVSFTFVQATLVTLSCFVRSSNLTTFNFRDFASPARNSRNFDPTTGLWAASGGDTQFTLYSVSSFDNGWYRISCNYLPTDATASRFFGVMIGQNAATSVDLGGMQIERYESARTYIPTTTAAVYGPRFDHDPVTLACKGLLIEESRTNLVFPSAALATQTRTVTAVAHTLSFYGTGTVVLSGVAVATVTGTGAYPTRTTLTFTPTAGSLILTVTGSVTQAQLEAGSFATSYIPTTTASVIRSADVCSISGSAFTGFWNQTSGTMLEVFEASPNTNTTYVSASNGNITQNSVHFDNDTGNMRAVYYSGSSIVATLSLGSVGTVGAVNKIASAYSVNDFSASRNGGTVVVDSAGAVPASLSQINIGTDERSQTPVSFYSNRCIGSLRYYKKRLSNSKLQTLTV